MEMICHQYRVPHVLIGCLALLALGSTTELGAADQADLAPPTSQTEPPDGEVQERGLPIAPAHGVQPNALAPLLRYTAPTANLTAVANSLGLKRKSLTTVITTGPGLILTQPVEISIAYISPAGSPPSGNRLTQPYQRKFGNRFVYHDPEGEGTPRHLRMDIWLTEPKPEGGHFSYSISWETDLDPLYDVTISPLAFELRSNCDYIGNSEIRFGWAYPDAVSPSARNKFHFTTTKGKTVWIQPFGWTRTELTTAAITSMNLHLPAIVWTEHDPNPGVPFEGLFRFSVVKLPGKTQLFDFALFPDQPYPGPDQIRGSTCIAHLNYKSTYSLRTYPNL
ncbi:MAG: hypothetical protein ACXWV7_05520 [Nitrospira sp.]